MKNELTARLTQLPIGYLFINLSSIHNVTLEQNDVETEYEYTGSTRCDRTPV